MSSARTTPGKGGPPKPADRRRGETPPSAKAPNPALPAAAPPNTPSSRAARAAERRQAIIDAALDEFIARGFTATPLVDGAKRAPRADGAVHTHFMDHD